MYPDNRYQRFDNRLTPTPAHVHSCAGVLFSRFAGRHRALCEQQSSVPNGIRNRRRTGRNKRPFHIGCFHLDYLVDLQTVILEIKRDGSRIGYESLSTGFPKLRITE